MGAVPASLIGNPADTVKKQIMVEGHASFSSAARAVWKAQGAAGFFRGYEANLLKDVPFAGIKLGLYESLKYWYLRAARKAEAGSLDTAAIGMLSGVASAVLTNPLDVVNTRLKAAASGVEGAPRGFAAELRHVAQVQPAALLSGVVPRGCILGFGSSFFWLVYAVVKRGTGAIEAR
mmetsp:Transcript_33429/g.105613  ORF Transcript_33429/g.105613 Transcript_33429/m.105613 type:complete len:177 (+) Transcript_33429:580-1110(+)